jgi:fatty acid desaturase
MAGKRDYSLLGRDASASVANGLSAAEWYHTEVPRKQMKDLMKREDGPAIRDTAIWLGCLVLFGGLGVYFWGSLWCIPFFLAYGVLYGSASDSRWHECGHGTAFKTMWMNDVVYQIACFMIMRNPVTWRWSHTRHHTDTVIVGRDPEIAVMRPPDLARLILNVFGLLDAWHAVIDMVRNGFGMISAAEKTFIPESEQPRAIRVARIWLVIYAATIALALYLGSVTGLTAARST